MIAVPSSSDSSPKVFSTESDAPLGGDIRQGSPFAAGSAKTPLGTGRWRNSDAIVNETIGEGVWRETAASAVFASGMLIGFAIPGWLWFPAGGIPIALLGAAMGLLGFSSRYTKLAATGLVIHGVILVGCYFRSM